MRVSHKKHREHKSERRLNFTFETFVPACGPLPFFVIIPIAIDGVALMACGGR